MSKNILNGQYWEPMLCTMTYSQLYVIFAICFKKVLSGTRASTFIWGWYFWFGQSKKDKFKRKHVDFDLAATGKMTLWEVWWTHVLVTACPAGTKYLARCQSFLLYDPTNLKIFTISLMSEWLSIVAFRCLERARVFNGYFANLTLPPRDQYLH